MFKSLLSVPYYFLFFLNPPSVANNIKKTMIKLLRKRDTFGLCYWCFAIKESRLLVAIWLAIMRWVWVCLSRKGDNSLWHVYVQKIKNTFLLFLLCAKCRAWKKDCMINIRFKLCLPLHFLYNYEKKILIIKKKLFHDWSTNFTSLM